MHTLSRKWGSIKKTYVTLPGIKITMSEMENTLNEIGECVDIAGEKIRVLKDAAVKPSELEQRKKQTGRNSEHQ